MKLIDILLENITPEDWPAEYPFAAQDKGSSTVYFYDEAPKVNKEDKCFFFTGSGKRLPQEIPMGKKWKKNIVTRDEFIDQYNNPWIKWKGGEMPVEKGTLVDVQYHNGEFNYGVKAGLRTKAEAGGDHQTAIAVSWDTDIFSNYTIIKYRRSIK